MPLILPNDIANEQDADGDKLQQNFATIEAWGNAEVITRDGATAMTAPLLLPGPPTQPNEAATKEYADTSGAFVSEIRMYGGDAAPNPSWMLCQGQAISRADYASLFAVVGVRFGPGDGSTTFNLPDYRGRYPFGYNSGGDYGTVGVGERFGSKDSTLPYHTHPGVDHLHRVTGGTGAESGQHHHMGVNYHAALLSGEDAGSGIYVGVAGGGIAPLYFSGTSQNLGNHSHGFDVWSAPADRSLTTGGAGAGATNTNLPPSLSCNFIMKVR